MSVYMTIAVPMVCVALTMFFLARKKRETNFLIPGLALLLAGFINLVLGLTVGW